MLRLQLEKRIAVSGPQANPIRDRHSQSHMTTPTGRGFLHRTKVERRRGTVYEVKLFATDPEGNESLVDETYIVVRGKQKAKKAKHVKKTK